MGCVSRAMGLSGWIVDPGIKSHQLHTLYLHVYVLRIYRYSTSLSRLAGIKLDTQHIHTYTGWGRGVSSHILRT